MNEPGMGRSRVRSGRRDTQTVSEGTDTRQPVSCVPVTMRTYCTGCGHDPDRHRNNRCWTGAEGEPLYRTRSLIACLCDGYQEAGK